MGFFDWLMAPSRTSRELARAATRGRRKGRGRRAAASRSSRPSSSAHSPAVQDRAARIRHLAGLGGSRTEAEDREFSRLLASARRNPPRGRRRKATGGKRQVASGGKKRRRNPSGGGSLATARRLSQAFHGRADEVVRLDRSERRLPQHATLVGEVVAIEYLPHGHSQRGSAVWRHESGDRGQGKPRAKGRPLLVVDPKSKQPAIVLDKSPMRFSGRRGLVG